MRILVFDIGNTLTKTAVFVDGVMVKKDAKPFDHAFSSLKSASFEVPNAVVVGSVTRAHNSLIQYLESMRVPVIELTPETVLPFSNQYSTPKTLGMDRLAGAAGAIYRYPKQNCLLIDAGTCIKYEFITDKGVYLGGNITPGLQMRTDAMHHFTAKLPTVSKDLPANIYGTNTTEALQNGVLRAAMYEIKGTVDAARAQFGDVQVLLTGGDAPLLLSHLEGVGIAFEPDVVLYGLYHIMGQQIVKKA
jgi:type III pantothenate kinase